MHHQEPSKSRNSGGLQRPFPLGPRDLHRRLTECQPVLRDLTSRVQTSTCRHKSVSPSISVPRANNHDSDDIRAAATRGVCTCAKASMSVPRLPVVRGDGLHPCSGCALAHEYARLKRVTGASGRR